MGYTWVPGRVLPGSKTGEKAEGRAQLGHWRGGRGLSWNWNPAVFLGFEDPGDGAKNENKTGRIKSRGEGTMGPAEKQKWSPAIGHK